MHNALAHLLDKISTIFIVLVVIVMVAGAVVAGVRRNLDKLQFDVPWLRWLTLEELVAMGHSRFWAELLLPVIYRKGGMEIRITDDLPEELREEIRGIGFCRHTVQFYKFKFTERWRRGRKVPRKQNMFDLRPIPIRI